LTAAVKEYALKLGADLIGIAPVSRWKHAPQRLSPKAHLPEAKSVVVIGIHHPDASVEYGGEPNGNYAGPFQIGMIPKLDTISRRMASFLEQNGTTAIPFPCTGFWRHRPFKEISATNTASFSHRHAAVAAGLGEFGWNNMFMSPKYGPRQRLVSVITSADLDADPLYDGPTLCDKCGMCEKHCPGRNFSRDLMMGVDKLVIGNKTYEYAKLNRWRCLWGEQFAFDMNELGKHDRVDEDFLYQAAREGVKRVGGEFGSCFRFCMAKPLRYWDKDYSRAPRRKKSRSSAGADELLENIKRLARQNGADRLVIRPLSEFSADAMNLPAGYPAEKLFKNFSWLISLGRRLPVYPHPDLGDNLDYLASTTKVRLSIGAYDIAAYLDDLGFEAMQDWTPLSALVQKKTDWNILPFMEGEPAASREHDAASGLPRAIRYAVAARNEAGVQREQISMTAGAQNGNSKLTEVISCGVICQAPMSARTEIFAGASLDHAFSSFLKNVDKIGIAKIDSLPKMPDMPDFSDILPGARSLIVLLAGFSKRMVDLAGKQEAEDATTYSFLQYQALRELLWTAHDVSSCLEAGGHRALPLADCTLSAFRTISPYWEFEWAKLGHPDQRANAPLAAAAGLGQLGQSGLLLTPEFGPRHKFVFVLTTAELPTTDSIAGAQLCLRCGKCADACPARALNKNSLQNIAGYDVFHRSETRCRWARSLGMVPDEGPKCLGWKAPDMPIPDEISEEKVQECLSQKDPLQTIGYRAPCHTDTIVERCLQACPVGK